MSEQELKEKIKKAIKNGFQKADCRKPYTNEPYPYFDSQINSIADALIAAEIGDVSEWKERAENFSYAYNACGNDLVEMEHRAEVAERALFNACRNIIADEKDGIEVEPRDEVLYKAYLKQAEKELKEERKDEQFYL